MGEIPVPMCICVLPGSYPPHNLDVHGGKLFGTNDHHDKKNCHMQRSG